MNKIQKQLRYLKICPLIKLKQFSVIFVLNHINNLTDHAKICVTLLIPKNIHNSYFNYEGDFTLGGISALR